MFYRTDVEKRELSHNANLSSNFPVPFADSIRPFSVSKEWALTSPFGGQWALMTAAIPDHSF